MCKWPYVIILKNFYFEKNVKVLCKNDSLEPACNGFGQTSPIERKEVLPLPGIQKRLPVAVFVSVFWCLDSVFQQICLSGVHCHLPDNRFRLMHILPDLPYTPAIGFHCRSEPVCHIKFNLIVKFNLDYEVKGPLIPPVLIVVSIIR